MTKKRLSLEEFTELTKELQLSLIQEQGVYVGKRKVQGQWVLLYQLYSFYVEITFFEYRKSVASLNITADTFILQPYLDQIDIKGFHQKKDDP